MAIPENHGIYENGKYCGDGSKLAPDLRPWPSDLITLSYKVFPCYSVDERGVCLCSNGKSCPTPGKHPTIKDNLNAATIDPNQINSWRQKGPVNFGIPTGPKNGIFVLDVDGDKGGRESLKKLTDTYGDLPETRTVATGNGTHYYFKYPGWFIKSDSNTLGAAEYPGLDTRGDGGYVMAPGSRHYSGASYNLLRDCEPAEAPNWLLDLLKHGHTAAKKYTNGHTTLREGQRNTGLTRLAGAMRHSGFDLEAIEAALLIENANKCEPPMSPHEVKKITRSVSRYEKGAAATPPSPMVVLPLSEFINRNYKKREAILLTPENFPVFQIPSINQFHSFRGVGKTLVALYLFWALGTGGKFFAYRVPRKLRVLYVEGELPGSDLQERLRSFGSAVDGLSVVCYEDQAEDYRSPLATEAGRSQIEAAIKKANAEVVILDSISSLGNFDTNKEENWLQLCEWLMKLRKMGLAVFYLQHDGKTGLQRGHSKPEDFLDRSVWLKWADGYEGEDGLKCVLGFDKNRGGPMGRYNRLSIELDHGTNQWTYSEAAKGAGSLRKRGGSPGDRRREEKVDYIRELRAQGEGWAKIAEQVNKRFDGSNINRNTARRWFEDSVAEDGLEGRLTLL